MEQQGLTQKDLVPLIGSRSKVSELLSRKRRFSLSMIRALHQELGIPAEVLLQDSRTSEVEARSQRNC
jgi:HTH-type transcriptional regulator/antitoxin HigA